MIIDSYNIIYLITNIFSIAIIHKFIRIFFEKRKTSKLICLLSYFLYFIVTSIIYLNINIPILTLSINWIIIFIITLNYKANISKCLLFSVYILIFMMIPEIIIVAITGYFNFSFFKVGSYSDSIGVITMRLLTYMEALLFKNFKSVKKNQVVNKTLWVALVLIPSVTLILEIMIIEAGNASQIKVILSVIMIFILNIIAFYLYDSLTYAYVKIANTTVLEKEKELYCKQCEIMQSSTKDLQAFRHDLKNQFIVVSELLESYNYEAAKSQIDMLSDKINKKIIYSTSGNIAIDGIINYKLQNAINEQINVNVDIAIPCDLNVEISDIVTIFGNLLDNALYAVMQIPENERSISIKTIYSNKRLFIQVVNPYNSEVYYENGEIVTSKNNREKHGYGLKSIEKAVDKYDGYMEINHNSGFFSVDILLYLFDNDKI